MSKPHSSALPILAAVLLLLPLLYVGSYLALVVPGGILVTPSLAPAPDGSFNPPAPSYHSDQYYRVGGPWTRRLFWPLEFVDRKLRPTEWAPGLWRFGDISSLNTESGGGDRRGRP